jgi:hypothetical protein
MDCRKVVIGRDTKEETKHMFLELLYIKVTVFNPFYAFSVKVKLSKYHSIKKHLFLN